MKIIISLLFVLSISAKTIIVTDIDDTIKVSHIRNKIAKYSNAFRTKNIFLGMSPLYKIMEEETSAEIFYLSNAPKSLMLRSHSTLLSNGNFPAGTLLLRPTGVSEKDHKRIALEQLINEQDVDSIILIGDNGEHDIRFYQDIASKYPRKSFYTYIRIAYDLDKLSSPTEGQVGFISPFEIAIDLADKGLISTQSTGDFYQEYSKNFLVSDKKKSTGMMFFPKWLGCKGHKSTKVLGNFNYPLSLLVNAKINRICN